MKALLSLLLSITILAACSKPEQSHMSDSADQNAAPAIAVSILPQRALLKALLGEPSQIIVMVPPGSSPETYAPTPRQMKDLAAAALYVRIGHITMETAWLEKFVSSFPQLKIIDPSRNIEFMTGHNHMDGHGHESAHDSGEQMPGIDPHIWLSPPLMIRYCRSLAALLNEQFPDRIQQINDNLQRLTEEIQTVDQEVRQILATHQGKTFMVFHPAWSYFARDYGLVQLAIEKEGKSPDPQHLKEMTDLAKNKGIMAIFIQNQFERRNAQALAEALGIQVIELDPLQEDWSEMILKTARAIAASFPQP